MRTHPHRVPAPQPGRRAEDHRLSSTGRQHGARFLPPRVLLGQRQPAVPTRRGRTARSRCCRASSGQPCGRTAHAPCARLWSLRGHPATARRRMRCTARRARRGGDGVEARFSYAVQAGAERALIMRAAAQRATTDVSHRGVILPRPGDADGTAGGCSAPGSGVGRGPFGAPGARTRPVRRRRLTVLHTGAHTARTFGGQSGPRNDPSGIRRGSVYVLFRVRT
jgi:hypothetical protein